MDYPLIHLAEFEWDGKLLRYKTGIQIGKQKPRIILLEFFFSVHIESVSRNCKVSLVTCDHPLLAGSLGQFHHSSTDVYNPH